MKNRRPTLSKCKLLCSCGFWEADPPLVEACPMLYAIASNFRLLGGDMSARSPIFHWDLGTELSRRWTWYYFYKMLNLSALGNNYRIWEPGKSGDFSVKSFYEKACERWRYFHALLLFKVSEGPSEGSFFFWMAYRGKSF